MSCYKSPTPPPHDWNTPDWKACGKVHDWKNYVREDVRAEWPNFTEPQRKMLAVSFQAAADLESWG